MMTADKRPIGVFDSGVGGLTVLRKLAELLPNENLIYLGDTARVPYGNKSPETIRLYAEQCAKFLLEQSVKLIVVACNTVSAVALNVIEEISNIPVIGMIRPGAEAAALQTCARRIGIIGTYATVQSKAYELAIRQLTHSTEVFVYAQACPLFVPLAEEGWHIHPATYAIAEEYLMPMKKANIDCLILGCTHYPLLKKVIQDIMPEVQLIDSGEESALVAQRILQQRGIAAENINDLRRIDCWITDIAPTFTMIAQKLLGLPFNSVHQAIIDAPLIHPVPSNVLTLTENIAESVKNILPSIGKEN